MSSKIAMGEIQTTVFNTLNNDATLQGLVNGVFDEITDSAEFPYIQIGDATENRFNTFDRFGKETLITIQIWSQQEGFNQGHGILERVNELLDYEKLTYNNFDQVLIQFEDAETIRDPDGFTRQISARYRVFLQEQ